MFLFFNTGMAHRPVRGHRRPRPGRSVKLHLEFLEDRTVLASLQYVSGSGLTTLTAYFNGQSQTDSGDPGVGHFAQLGETSTGNDQSGLFGPVYELTGQVTYPPTGDPLIFTNFEQATSSYNASTQARYQIVSTNTSEQVGESVVITFESSTENALSFVDGNETFPANVPSDAASYTVMDMNGNIVSSGNLTVPPSGGSTLTYVPAQIGDTLVENLSSSDAASLGGTSPGYYATDFMSGASLVTDLGAPPPPVVSSLNPNSGTSAGGTSVTITGTGFTGATGVKFGSTPAAPFRVVNDSTIVATSPAGPAGTVDVTVQTPDGISAVVAGDQFTFNQDELYVNPGPPAQVLVNAPFEVEISALNADGNPDPNFTGQVSLSLVNPNPGNNAILGGTGVPTVRGAADFTNLTVNTVGTGYTIQASSSGLDAVTTDSFDVVSDKLVVTQPPTPVPGGGYAMQVSAEKPDGTVDTTYNQPVNLLLVYNPGNDTLGGTTVVNAVNGVANFPNVTLTGPGTSITVGATSPGAVSVPGGEPISVNQLIASKLGVVNQTSSGLLQWVENTSGSGTYSTSDPIYTYGLNSDSPVVGNWTGSGYTEIGVVRPLPLGALEWILNTTGTGTYSSADTVDLFGAAGNTPVVGDWTGSGTTKIGIVRPTSLGLLQWVLDTSGTGVYTSRDAVDTYGLATDTPVVGDWNGNGTDEIGVVRPTASGALEWVLNSSGTGSYNAGDTVYFFGANGDLPVVGDWNGSGKDEIGVFVPQANGSALWVLDTAGTGVYTSSDPTFTYGASTSHPVVGIWQPPAALYSATGVLNNAVQPLADDAVFQSTVNQAIAAWQQAGLSSQLVQRLETANYGVGTLGNDLLGETNGNNVVIDATAQGHDWSESATPQPGQMDLCTALEHEMGHVLGLPDQNGQPNDLMFYSLQSGVCKTASAQDVDAVFATLSPLAGVPLD